MCQGHGLVADLEVLDLRLLEAFSNFNDFVIQGTILGLTKWKHRIPVVQQQDVCESLTKIVSSEHS